MEENKISKYYISTDLHFFHKAMQKYCNRPANFNDIIINQWKNTVGVDDIIIILGDVTWGSQEDLKNIMNELPGTKILVRGNHDKNHSNNWFIQAGFAFVAEKIQVSGIIFSHFPSYMSQEEIDRGIINVHGHFHNNPISKWEKELGKRITKNHYLMILEDIEYKPISLDKIKRRKFVVSTYDKINKGI